MSWYQWILIVVMTIIVLFLWVCQIIAVIQSLKKCKHIYWIDIVLLCIPILPLLWIWFNNKIVKGAKL